LNCSLFRGIDRRRFIILRLIRILMDIFALFRIFFFFGIFDLFFLFLFFGLILCLLIYLVKFPINDISHAHLIDCVMSDRFIFVLFGGLTVIFDLVIKEIEHLNGNCFIFVLFFLFVFLIDSFLLILFLRFNRVFFFSSYSEEALLFGKFPLLLLSRSQDSQHLLGSSLSNPELSNANLVWHRVIIKSVLTNWFTLQLSFSCLLLSHDGLLALSFFSK
jgi:hypothetical protein